MEFSDVSFIDKHSNVDEMLVRAEKYFNDQFSPYRSFSFELLPVIRLSRNQAWYGANSTAQKDEHIDQLVRDACSLAGRDLSAYDNDGDGIIDNICIITAGKNEADGGGVDCIWPQQVFLHERAGTFTSGGKTVDSFTVCAETSRLGTFCHEFAHSLGLQDLYDTDGTGSGGRSIGVYGSLSLMDSGLKNNGGDTPPNFCAIELEQLGIGNPVPMQYGFNTLRPLSASKEYLRIESDTEDEYFLLEYRDKNGWDEFAGAEGLIIYHIDKSTNNSWYSDYFKRNLSAAERWQSNQVNCRTDHQCAMVISAIPGTLDVKYTSYPQQGRNSLGSETDPAFRFWSGATSGQTIYNISYLEDGRISFRIITPITMREISAFQDAAILSWVTHNSLQVKECVVSWRKEGDKSASGTSTQKINFREDGYYTAILEKLSPSSTYTVTIKVICEDGAVHSKTETVTTKSYKKGMRPFIYLSLSKRLEDGTFPTGEKIPLRVYNAEDVERVVWLFNDRVITPGEDGFWHLPGSGTLKARVWYNDGSADVIIKKIVAR